MWPLLVREILPDTAVHQGSGEGGVDRQTIGRFLAQKLKFESFIASISEDISLLGEGRLASHFYNFLSSLEGVNVEFPAACFGVGPVDPIHAFLLVFSSDKETDKTTSVCSSHMSYHDIRIRIRLAAANFAKKTVPKCCFRKIGP